MVLSPMSRAFNAVDARYGVHKVFKCTRWSGVIRKWLTADVLEKDLASRWRRKNRRAGSGSPRDNPVTSNRSIRQVLAVDHIMLMASAFQPLLAFLPVRDPFQAAIGVGRRGR